MCSGTGTGRARSVVKGSESRRIEGDKILNPKIMSEGTYRDATALDAAAKDLRNELVFDSYRWSSFADDKYATLHMADSKNGAEAEVVITSVGYQIYAYVDNRRVSVKGDGEAGTANYRHEAISTLKEINKAVQTRINNRRKNKARREAAEEKRAQKQYERMQRMINEGW